MSTRALLESTGDGGVDKRGACHSTFVNCYRRRRRRRVDAKSSGCLSIRPPTARRAAPRRAGPCRVTPSGRRSAGDLLPGVTAASGGRSPATSVLLSTRRTRSSSVMMRNARVSVCIKSSSAAAAAASHPRARADSHNNETER